MNLGLSNIASFLGMNIEHIILIVVMFGMIIFFAQDVKLGFMMSFIASGCLFMWFYGVGWNYYYALTLFFLSLIGMVITLIFSSGVAGNQGGYI